MSSAAESATDVSRHSDDTYRSSAKFQSVPAHGAIRFAVNTRDRPMPGRTGSVREIVLENLDIIRGSGVQLKVDVGLSADAGWDMADDRDVCRAQRPVAGQAVQ